MESFEEALLIAAREAPLNSRVRAAKKKLCASAQQPIFNWFDA